MITPEKLSELLSANGLILCNQRNRKKPVDLLAKAINKELKASK